MAYESYEPSIQSLELTRAARLAIKKRVTCSSSYSFRFTGSLCWLVGLLGRPDRHHRLANKQDYEIFRISGMIPNQHVLGNGTKVTSFKKGLIILALLPVF